MIDHEPFSSEKGINEQVLTTFHSIRIKRQQRKLRDNRLKAKKKKKVILNTALSSATTIPAIGYYGCQS